MSRTSKTFMKTHLRSLLLLGILITVVSGPAASACSRATWLGKDGTAITGRSMDWPYDFDTHFYVIPRGEKNEGLPGGHSW
jgi:choloylglycine hydrolase